MAKSALIDYSIMSAWDWAQEAPPSKIKGKDKTWKEDAKEQWENKVRRAPFDYDALADAAKIGISMEKEIARYARMEKLAGTENMQKMISACIGGQFQKKLSKKMEIAGEKCFLFGKADVWWPERIIDIKTTKAKEGKPFDEEKYATSFQGLLYSYLNGTKQFDYLVAELTPDSTVENPEIMEVHIVESGFFGEQQTLENMVVNKIEAFIEGLKSEGYWDVYKNDYCLY